MKWVTNLVGRVRALVRQLGQLRSYMRHTQAGVVVNEDTALTFGAVWACVRVISETLASLPWVIYQRTGSGREPLDNQVSRLLNVRPNPEQTAFSFREAIVAHVLTWGNGYAEIQRDMLGRAVALWLITPDRVIVERDIDNDGALRYRVRTEGAVEDRLLQPADVLHIHGLGYDGIVGYSPVRMAARSIGVGVAQDTFAGSFYQNGTHVGGTLEVDAKLDPGQIETLENYMNDRHRGPDKAFGVKVIGQGSKYTGYTMPLNDAQFIESRRFSITEVARWFRVPPHKIADLERSTNNNIEHQSIEFVTDTVIPWAMRLEQEANAKLLIGVAKNVQYSKLSANALMRGDSKSRADFYAIMMRTGAMMINEVRELEDLPSLGAIGDQPLVQLNQTTLEHLIANPPSANTKAPAAGDPGSDEPGTPGEPDPGTGDPKTANNVIRQEALAWWRANGRQA